ncbi:MAG: response regulator [Balneolaceae bacterium]|nr:response regulator [Balneolaceae bacterium]
MKRVLIVEDCHIQSTVVKKMLESEAFTVTAVCRSGEEVLEQLKIDVPDIILMDIFINGDMNGIETMKIVRKSHSMPVIFITALTKSELHDEALSMSPSDLLTKPISKAELLSTIEQLLNDVVEA